MIKVRINFADLTSTVVHISKNVEDLDAVITLWVREIYSPTAVITGYHIITSETHYTREELTHA